VECPVEVHRQHAPPVPAVSSSDGAVWNIPALLTTASSRPNRSSAVSTTAVPPSGVATVTLIAEAFALGAVRGPARYAAPGEMGVVWRLATSTGEWAVKSLVEAVDPTTGTDVDYQLPLPAAVGASVPAPAHLGRRRRRGLRRRGTSTISPTETPSCEPRQRH
jgi:hypothetical protein